MKRDIRAKVPASVFGEHGALLHMILLSESLDT
jgi:hypothetical protein